MTGQHSLCLFRKLTKAPAPVVGAHPSLSPRRLHPAPAGSPSRCFSNTPWGPRGQAVPGLPLRLGRDPAPSLPLWPPFRCPLHAQGHHALCALSGSISPATTCPFDGQPLSPQALRFQGLSLAQSLPWGFPAPRKCLSPPESKHGIT